MRAHQTQRPAHARARGFSLLELLIAMAVALVLLGIASTLVAGAFNVRARENQRSDALADAQRALNFMTRDIANAGFGLRNNGLIAADSGVNSIRVRANLNAFSGQTTSDRAIDPDEDVEYRLISDGTNSYLVRLDINTNNQTTILANRIDQFRIRYFNAKVDYTSADCNITPTSGGAEVTPDLAQYVVLTLCVQLPARGSFGQFGYQPPSRVQLVSDVTLRNANLAGY